ncbi:MAG: hypothetical protein K2L83_00330 [Muribaculaceae bacterium]|nr:hypothetical protein [Muribaculaceae bacterium]
MKKLLSMLVVMLACVASASAISPSYKGYGELYTGYSIPAGDYYNGGGVFGVSTSHGVTLSEGLFVGLGLDAALSFYSEADPYSRYDDSDYSGLFAIFAESRYNILPSKRISPFVGLRLGGGYNGYDEVGSFYFSPAIGCTFNLTEKFGLDASIGYSLYTGEGQDEGSYYNDSAGSINCITFRIGVHF